MMLNCRYHFTPNEGVSKGRQAHVFGRFPTLSILTQMELKVNSKTTVFWAFPACF